MVTGMARDLAQRISNRQGLLRPPKGLLARHALAKMREPGFPVRRGLNRSER